MKLVVRDQLNYNRGYQEGLAEGREEGRREGLRESYEEGRREGFREGLREGLREAMAEGESAPQPWIRELKAKGLEDKFIRIMEDASLREQLYRALGIVRPESPVDLSEGDRTAPSV